jgi:hypothetical protein
MPGIARRSFQDKTDSAKARLNLNSCYDDQPGASPAHKIKSNDCHQTDFADYRNLHWEGLSGDYLCNRAPPRARVWAFRFGKQEIVLELTKIGKVTIACLLFPGLQPVRSTDPAVQF